MSRNKILIILLLTIGCIGFLVGCGNHTGSSFYGTSSYGFYNDYYRYRYYPYRYGNHDDVYIKVDRDKLEQRRDQIRENKPQRQQRIKEARSRAARMGRPIRPMKGGRR